MATTVKRRATSFRLPPNATTLAAMAEVKSGAELDELTDENIDNIEDYIKSL